MTDPGLAAAGDDCTRSRDRTRTGDSTRSRDSLHEDDRAVSVSVGYVLNLAVATLLLSGLFVAGGSFVASEREAAVHGELTVIGERTAADIMTVDRLAANAESENATVVRNADLPARASGSGYRIAVVTDGDDDGLLRLTHERSDADVEVPFRVRTEVEETTVAGGDLTIQWDAGNETVVVAS